MPHRAVSSVMPLFRFSFSRWLLAFGFCLVLAAPVASAQPSSQAAQPSQTDMSPAGAALPMMTPADRTAARLAQPAVSRPGSVMPGAPDQPHIPGRPDVGPGVPPPRVSGRAGTPGAAHPSADPSLSAAPAQPSAQPPASAARRRGARPAAAVSTASGFALRSTVLRAITYSPNLKSTREKRQSAAYDIDRARAGYFPKVQLSAGTGVSQQESVYTRSIKEDDSALGTSRLALTLIQPLWDGLATYGNVGARNARFISADQRLRNNALTLAFDAIVAHVDLNQRRELLALAMHNEEVHKHVAALQRDSYAQGFSSLGEVRQIEGRLSRATATRMDYDYALQQAETVYLRLTGTAASKNLAPAAMPSRQHRTLGEARGASKYANPLVLASAAEIDAARAEETVARSGFSPKFNLETGPSWSHQAGRTGEQKGVSLMLTMNWEIFSGGADLAATRMAASQTRQMRQELHAVLDNLDSEIRTTWEQLQTAQRLALEYQRAMKASREARYAYQYQFSMGTRSLLDVLDAENEYFASATQQILSRNNVIIGRYRLLGLSGELLEEMGFDSGKLRDNAPTIQENISVEGIMSMSNLEDAELIPRQGRK